MKPIKGGSVDIASNEDGTTALARNNSTINKTEKDPPLGKRYIMTTKNNKTTAIAIYMAAFTNAEKKVEAQQAKREK